MYHRLVMNAVGVQPPSGVVTFLFTDVEGSSRLWDQHPALMGPALARHDEIMTETIAAHRGYIFSLAGDSFAAVFAAPSDAIEAARALQRSLVAEPWPEAVPIRVRMGMYTGTAEERGGDYFGPDVNRTARLMSAGHGGQVLVSATTAVLVRDATFSDLGIHRLRDLSAPEQIFQLYVEGCETDFPPLATIDVGRTNLPVRIDSFHGRSDELELLTKAASRHGCITICGPGGMGKTTIAQQLAAQLSRSSPGGTWLVELAPVLDPTAVPYQIADDIGAPVERGRPVLASIVDHLFGEPAVLVLDNCEHVIDAAGAVVRELLASCPELTVVATSRGPLGVPGEQLHVLGPLDCSNVDSPAVELFAQRLAEANIGIDVSGPRREVLLRICRELDGLPLAIELAAARGRSMTPEDIAARLGQRFRLLRGRKQADDRHSTLRSTIEWSYQMLDETQRLLLARLGVFAGRFDIVAVERICADERVEDLDIVDLLGVLVDQSMVVVNLDGSTASYSLLNTIREFALEELGSDAGEFLAEHAAYYTDLVEGLAERAQTADEVRAVAALEDAWEDIRAAARHCVRLGDRELSSRLLGALVFEVLFRNRGEVAGWLEPALELHRDHLSDSSIGLRAVHVSCAAASGDNDTVVSAGAAYAAAARGRPELTSATDMAVVGFALHLAGEAGHALELYELALAQTAGTGVDRGRMWAYALTSLLYTYTGQLEDARDAAKRARELLSDESAISQVVGLELIDSLRGEDAPEAIADRMAAAVEQATLARSWLIRNVAEMVGAGARAELGELPRAMIDAADTLSRHRSSGALAVVSQQLRRCAVLLMDAERYAPAELILEFLVHQRTPAPNPHTAEQLAAHEEQLAALPAEVRSRISAMVRRMTLDEVIDSTIEDLRSASARVA